jgi:type IV pilus assembly protein PilM
MAESTFAVLNLGSQRVSGAVFSKARSGDLVLQRFAFAEMLGDASGEATRLPQLRVAVLELADKLKLKGRNVWYAIAGHIVFTRFVKLPPFQDDKADQIVEFEARQNVPFPINEVIWDYEFIDVPGSTEREVALVAIKADALNDVNDQVESVGLVTVGVDLAPLAVYNAFRYSYPDVNEPALIIDLGARSTNLVFVEGGKVFTRNILVGGSTVTGAVAKEIGGSFGEVEAQKRNLGFVAPGGAYEPHEDETVDAISKIMRNTMTRLHGEVVRTINYYRNQQNGTPPQKIFLCGGGAHTPLVVEFFQDKFSVPVEMLNPLRGVQFGKRVDVQAAQANAASMAELVGLALRHAGATPLEVELVPDTVELRRDAAKRTPFLIMATVCLFAALFVAVFFYKRAESAVQKEVVKLKATRSALQKDTAALREVDRNLEMLKGQSAQLEQAVLDRGFWVRLLAVMNNKFENDFLWVTEISINKNGSPLVPPPAGSSGSAPAVTPPAATSGQVGAPPLSQYEMAVHGLYRKDGGGGPQVVYKYFDDLKAMSDYFVMPKPEDKPKVDVGLEDDRYAYRFSFSLPLAPGMKFEK